MKAIKEGDLQGTTLITVTRCYVVSDLIKPPAKIHLKQLLLSLSATVPDPCTKCN